MEGKKGVETKQQQKKKMEKRKTGARARLWRPNTERGRPVSPILFLFLFLFLLLLLHRLLVSRLFFFPLHNPDEHSLTR